MPIATQLVNVRGRIQTQASLASKSLTFFTVKGLGLVLERDFEVFHLLVIVEVQGVDAVPQSKKLREPSQEL